MFIINLVLDESAVIRRCRACLRFVHDAIRFLIRAASRRRVDPLFGSQDTRPADPFYDPHRNSAINKSSRD